MPNKWNERDLLRLTRDCELGAQGALLHVAKTDGPYMTVRRHVDGVVMHTGRDYAFATKIGEGATDDSDVDPPSFGWTLADCEARLREVVRRMRRMPTARRLATQVAEVCDRLEKIAEEFAGTDHAGST